MKMQNLFTTVSLAAILSYASAARADDSLYYSGSFECSGREYATDWVISNGLGGDVTATVYYQAVGSDSVNWLDLSERKSDGGNQLVDDNGNVRLAVMPGTDKIRALWKAGAPSSTCSPFEVSASESPIKRFDEIFALMETPEPSADIAAQVADKTRHPPIVHTLPELDRQTYLQRYSELVGTFWTKYRETVASELASLPLETDDDKKAFADRVSVSLGDLPNFLRQRDGFKFMLSLMQQASDRYAARGGIPADDLYSGKANLCTRMQTILKDDPYYEFSKLELATGVASDYWTRPLAEDLLEAIRSCADVPDDYAQQLARKWPEIQERQAMIRTLQEEQSRLLSLPLTLDTLAATNALQPEEKIARSLPWNSNDYQRFFGKPLEARREQLIATSLTEIGEQAASYSLDKAEVAKTISDACDALQRLSRLADEVSNRIREGCQSAEEQIAEKQAEQAVQQITAAFENAEPETAAATAAAALCDTLPGTLTNHRAASQAYEACSTAKQGLEKKTQALKCEQAIAASGAPSDLLESTVFVLDAGGGTKALVKDLICNALMNMKARLSFSSSGYLAWKQHQMTMEMEQAREGEGPLNFILMPAETDVDWIVTSEDEATLAMLSKEKARVEIVTACIMRTAGCQP